MGSESLDKEEIFHAAVALTDAVARAAFVAAACQHDAELRAEVDELLKHDAEAGTFLEKPAVAVVEMVGPVPCPYLEGSAIGPYKLLEQIGEGGMGSVWVAQQTQPVRRRVALKLIKPGMDSRRVLSRFEAERQALAMMDHPNIAKVFDGGVTDRGHPYFVMEYVKGLPITDYCDQARLGARRAPQTVRASLPCDPARASKRDHPPRSQAVQRAGLPV